MEVTDLSKEPEIFDWDRNKPQILTGRNYVENAHIAVGFSSVLMKDGIFDTAEAIRIANELCAYMRLFGDGKVE